MSDVRFPDPGRVRETGDIPFSLSQNPPWINAISWTLVCLFRLLFVLCVCDLSVTLHPVAVTFAAWMCLDGGR